MFNLIKGFLLAPSTHKIASSTYKSIKNQPWAAPYTLALSLVGAAGLMFTSGYRVYECVADPVTRDSCDEVIEVNLPIFVSSVFVISGSWGGFNTYNKRLHEEDEISIEQRVRAMIKEGMSQRDVAQATGLSRYMVRKHLGLS